MNRKLVVISALLIVCLLTVSVDAAGKKSRTKKKNPLDKRPSDIEPQLYCNACQAITREVLKVIRTSTKDYEISAALDRICDQRNYSVYEYPPPDMAKGCTAFIMGWEEVIEKALATRNGNDEVENEICINRTKACLGVDVTAKTGNKNQQFVTVNNKQVPIGPDGSIDMSNTDL